MSLKEIIKYNQGAHVVGQMYRVAELSKKMRKESSRLAKSK